MYTLRGVANCLTAISRELPEVGIAVYKETGFEAQEMALLVNANLSAISLQKRPELLRLSSRRRQREG